MVKPLDLFEYLCYGSNAIINIFKSFSADTDFRRQILTYNMYKVGLSAEFFVLLLDHMYQTN